MSTLSILNNNFPGYSIKCDMYYRCFTEIQNWLKLNRLPIETMTILFKNCIDSLIWVRKSKDNFNSLHIKQDWKPDAFNAAWNQGIWDGPPGMAGRENEAFIHYVPPLWWVFKKEWSSGGHENAKTMIPGGISLFLSWREKLKQDFKQSLMFVCVKMGSQGSSLRANSHNLL